MQGEPAIARQERSADAHLAAVGEDHRLTLPELGPRRHRAGHRRRCQVQQATVFRLRDVSQLLDR